MKVDTGDHWNSRDHGTLQYMPLDLDTAAAQAWVLGPPPPPPRGQRSRPTIAMVSRIRRASRHVCRAAAMISSLAFSTQAAETPLRAAVLGGGVGGCAAAGRLASAGSAVALIEMGRGPGGRSATRRSTSDERVAVSHGAPMAQIETPEGLLAAERLAAGGFLRRALRSPARVRVSGGGTAFEVEEAAAPCQSATFVGVPGMSGICEGLLSDGGDNVKPFFGDMAKRFEPVLAPDGGVRAWRVFGRQGDLVAEAEWLIVTGSGVVHPRWTQIFGGDPPLAAAAASLGDAALQSAVERVAAIGAVPVQVAMLALEGECAERWADLPMDVAELRGDDVLAKVIIDRVGGGVVNVVAHSTRGFADGAKDAFGSSSTAARVGGAAAEKGREEQVLDALMEALGRFAAHMGVGVEGKDVLYGPMLHRWGNAFPEGGALPLEDAVCEQARVAFAGDFVGERSGSVEGAMLSGRAVAERILSTAQ